MSLASVQVKLKRTSSGVSDADPGGPTGPTTGREDVTSASMYQRIGSTSTGEIPAILLRDELAARYVPVRHRATRAAGDSVRAAGRAMARWYRAGQLGGDDALRLGRWTGARC